MTVSELIAKLQTYEPTAKIACASNKYPFVPTELIMYEDTNCLILDGPGGFQQRE